MAKKFLLSTTLAIATCSILTAQTPVWPVKDALPDSLSTYADFVQPTVSGKSDSALFGCVRTNGRQFHEGLDVAPVQPRKRGEATDIIVAIYDGVVAHLSKKSGNSSYGRYVVIEHTQSDLVIFSLYAHLAKVDDALKIGQAIQAGSPIGIMGRSAGNYTIPRERAHLHLEIGLRLTNQFDRWYKRQSYDNPNHHNVYNGMNLVSWNSLDFYQAIEEGRADSPLDYISQISPAVMLHVSTGRRPDFIERYPELVVEGCAEADQAGWEILLSAWGMPLSFKPISKDELKGVLAMGDISVLGINRVLLSDYGCRSIISEKSGKVSLGKTGKMIIELLFMPNPGGK